MKSVTIQPAQTIRGEIHVPGDKSISHRALMLGALARGVTRVTNLSSGQDVTSTRRCLSSLGISIENQENVWYIEGNGFSSPALPLNCGNSGTTLRLLSGLLAGQPFDSVLSGDDSLCGRPMGRIIDPLTEMGALVQANDRQPPLRISGRPLKGIHWHSPVASAQIKSCVLLAGLLAQGTTTVTEPALSRDHTERMLAAFGVDVTRHHLTVSVQGGSPLTAAEVWVPGDISSAAFWMAAAALLDGPGVTLKDVGLNPTRTGIIDLLTDAGLAMSVTNQRTIAGEPLGDLTFGKSTLQAFRIEGDLVPRLIDEIPVLAVLATQAHGISVFKNIGELRVKETDRIRAVTENLKKMGADLEETADSLTISGPVSLKGARLNSFGDHRMAMAFAVAGLAARGETRIENAACADISYPGFFTQLENATHA